jgi:hypothetical protein
MHSSSPTFVLHASTDSVNVKFVGRNLESSHHRLIIVALQTKLTRTRRFKLRAKMNHGVMRNYDNCSYLSKRTIDGRGICLIGLGY